MSRAFSAGNRAWGDELRANALGWYETGRWPERNGVSPQARIGQQGRGYMKMYIFPIYKRRPNPALSRLLKKSVLRPSESGCLLPP